MDWLRSKCSWLWVPFCFKNNIIHRVPYLLPLFFQEEISKALAKIFRVMKLVIFSFRSHPICFRWYLFHSTTVNWLLLLLLLKSKSLYVFSCFRILLDLRQTWRHLCKGPILIACKLLITYTLSLSEVSLNTLKFFIFSGSFCRSFFVNFKFFGLICWRFFLKFQIF